MGTFQWRLAECLEKGQDGRLKMTITLPDKSVSLPHILDSLQK